MINFFFDNDCSFCLKRPAWWITKQVSIYTYSPSSWARLRPSHFYPLEIILNWQILLLAHLPHLCRLQAYTIIMCACFCFDECISMVSFILFFYGMRFFVFKWTSLSKRVVHNVLFHNPSYTDLHLTPSPIFEAPSWFFPFSCRVVFHCNELSELSKFA
jgi:hypothetical protein